MRSGRLRKTWVIERPRETQDATGSVIQTWELLGRRRMDVTALRGQEREIARQESAQVTHRARLRWDSSLADLHARDRIRSEHRLFDIEYVNNVQERDRQFELMLREVT